MLFRILLLAFGLNCFMFITQAAVRQAEAPQLEQKLLNEHQQTLATFEQQLKQGLEELSKIDSYAAINKLVSIEPQYINQGRLDFIFEQQLEQLNQEFKRQLRRYAENSLSSDDGDTAEGKALVQLLNKYHLYILVFDTGQATIHIDDKGLHQQLKLDKDAQAFMQRYDDIFYGFYNANGDFIDDLECFAYAYQWEQYIQDPKTKPAYQALGKQRMAAYLLMTLIDLPDGMVKGKYYDPWIKKLKSFAQQHQGTVCAQVINYYLNILLSTGPDDFDENCQKQVRDFFTQSILEKVPLMEVSK